jgi:NADH-quinone oxidoreductase subunit J
MPSLFLLVLSTLGALTILGAAIAVTQKNLLRAVVAYAVSSICLAAIFYLLASPFAAALELTVGAGLVAVLFLVSILLTGAEEEEMPA